MTILIFILGLFLGSFVGVIIKRQRLPRTIFFERSHCDWCRKSLAPRELIPVLSYLWQGGKCRHCHKPIAWFYPVVELLTGLGLALNWLILSERQVAFPELIISSLIFLVLVAVIGIDLEKMIIPDWLLVILGLLVAVDLVLGQRQLENLFGALLGGGFLALLALAGRGKWMGWGDVKLMTILGVWLGYPLVIGGLFIGFVLGAIIALGLIASQKKTLKDIIPFGPFLALGALLIYWTGFNLLDYIFY